MIFKLFLLNTLMISGKDKQFLLLAEEIMNSNDILLNKQEDVKRFINEKIKECKEKGNGDNIIIKNNKQIDINNGNIPLGNNTVEEKVKNPDNKNLPEEKVNEVKEKQDTKPNDNLNVHEEEPIVPGNKNIEIISEKKGKIEENGNESVKNQKKEEIKIKEGINIKETSNQNTKTAEVKKEIKEEEVSKKEEKIEIKQENNIKLEEKIKDNKTTEPKKEEIKQNEEIVLKEIKKQDNKQNEVANQSETIKEIKGNKKNEEEIKQIEKKPSEKNKREKGR